MARWSFLVNHVGAEYSSTSSMRTARVPLRIGGFTLLEVLVALLLLSLALVALMRLSALDLRASAQLRDSTFAQWVAANVLAETRLRNELPPVGRSNGEARMAEQRWHWELAVTQTEAASVRRLDVTVRAAGEEGRVATTDDGVAAQLTGFAVQP